MSWYIGYDQKDNERRKSNNTGDEIGSSTNNNVKSYSTKVGQLSMKSQTNKLINGQKKLNKKQKVTKLSDLVCPVEKIAFLKARGL